jgi:alkylation response protein AidB-like acyl-CoA dehydrogenase
MTGRHAIDTLDDDTFRAEIREWIEANYPPGLRNPPKRLHLRENFPWFKALSDKGWIAPGWPVEYGGMGLSPGKQVIFSEELERHGCCRLHDHGLILLGPLIIKFGTPSQKSFFLPKLLTGEHIWCQGYSEPGAGSDLASLRTRAELQDGEWVINGQKTWTTMANDANWIFVLVRTDPARRKQEGISFLMVPMDSPGVTVRPILNLEMHDEFCEVFFDDVRVPSDNLIGEVNRGWDMAKALLGFERIFLGLPRQATYALARLVDLGRHLGMLEDPVFLDECARFSLDLENHNALFALFLLQISAGREVGAEISLLKISQSELFRRITDYMMEIAGPEGARLDQVGQGGTFSPSGLFLQARPATIYGGSSEIQRNIIAKAVLELPS